MQKEDLSLPIIVFDCKQVFSELESDYLEQLSAICGAQGDLAKVDFDACGGRVESVQNLELAFGSFLRAEVLCTEVDD